MKILLWIEDSPNQKALANKINEHFPISGIITETRKVRRRWTIKLVVEKIYEKIFLPVLGESWWKMLRNYEEKYPNYPKVSILKVENINSLEAFNFTNEIQPDLILVSGTRLVKEKLLSLQPKIGILNLHTGLSPYVKGGPNCTNWCIVNKQFHLIGNTIMWIDLGIDSGNILTTELTRINGKESLLELHEKVMNHGHDLYVRAIQFLKDEKFQSVPQNEISEGTTYYSKEWTLTKKRQLVKNFNFLKEFPFNHSENERTEDIKTIPL